MEIADFVEARRPRWQQLEGLLQKAEVHGLQRMSMEEAQALSRTYRSASADLLWVRARSAQAEVTDYLNDLVGRAYALTYPGRRARLSDALRFFARGFPDDAEVYAGRYPHLSEAHLLADHQRVIDDGAFEAGLEALLDGLELRFSRVRGTAGGGTPPP